MAACICTRPKMEIHNDFFAILGDGNELKKLDRDVLRKSLTSDLFGKLNIDGGMLKGN